MWNSMGKNSALIFLLFVLYVATTTQGFLNERNYDDDDHHHHVNMETSRRHDPTESRRNFLETRANLMRDRESDPNGKARRFSGKQQSNRDDLSYRDYARERRIEIALPTMNSREIGRKETGNTRSNDAIQRSARNPSERNSERDSSVSARRVTRTVRDIVEREDARLRTVSEGKTYSRTNEESKVSRQRNEIDDNIRYNERGALRRESEIRILQTQIRQDERDSRVARERQNRIYSGGNRDQDNNRKINLRESRNEKRSDEDFKRVEIRQEQRKNRGVKLFRERQEDVRKSKEQENIVSEERRLNEERRDQGMKKIESGRDRAEDRLRNNRIDSRDVRENRQQNINRSERKVNSRGSRSEERGNEKSRRIITVDRKVNSRESRVQERRNEETTREREREDREQDNIRRISSGNRYVNSRESQRERRLSKDLQRAEVRQERRTQYERSIKNRVDSSSEQENLRRIVSDERERESQNDEKRSGDLQRVETREDQRENRDAEIVRERQEDRSRNNRFNSRDVRESREQENLRRIISDEGKLSLSESRIEERRNEESRRTGIDTRRFISDERNLKESRLEIRTDKTRRIEPRQARRENRDMDNTRRNVMYERKVNSRDNREMREEHIRENRDERRVNLRQSRNEERSIEDERRIENRISRKYNINLRESRSEEQRNFNARMIESRQERREPNGNRVNERNIRERRTVLENRNENNAGNRENRLERSERIQTQMDRVESSERNEHRMQSVNRETERNLNRGDISKARQNDRVSKESRNNEMEITRISTSSNEKYEREIGEERMSRNDFSRNDMNRMHRWTYDARDFDLQMSLQPEGKFLDAAKTLMIAFIVMQFLSLSENSKISGSHGLQGWLTSARQLLY